MVLTEDLGLTVEQALCIAFNIPYEGSPFKYDMKEANDISEKIKTSASFSCIPKIIKHTAQKGSRYDYLLEDNSYLSCKSTKKLGKVCPQVIGQPSKKRFCEYFKINEETTIKQYILENVKFMLNEYMSHTFDGPMLYYNKKEKTMLYIKLINPIIWDNYIIDFSHITKNKVWNESTTIKINNNSIGEFQVHNKRNCIKFRWCLEQMLILFKSNFEVITIFQ
uniref:Uncharacterized protein n=1 Tax=viral metagenome TaxID=1070528 RepID=A0A6C0JMH7_9ZZZZ